MQVNSVNYNSNPSFGMAKLTKRGAEFVRANIGELNKFVDPTPYKTRNLLPKILNDVKAEKLGGKDISAFFDAANTAFQDANAKFVKNQVTTMSAGYAIDSFIKKGTPIDKKTGKLETAKATENVKTLVGELKKLFDINVSNPDVSAKDGKKILNHIQGFLSNEEIASRHSAITNKTFFIR